MQVTFELTVTPDFWDQPREWPVECRPIVFSTAAVMRNQGTLQVPAGCADIVERRLREHPQVIAVSRVPLPFPRREPRTSRRAA